MVITVATWTHLWDDFYQRWFCVLWFWIYRTLFYSCCTPLNGHTTDGTFQTVWVGLADIPRINISRFTSTHRHLFQLLLPDYDTVLPPLPF